MPADLALDQRDVVLAVHQRAVADRAELAELGGQARLHHALDQLVVLAPVGDQIRHRDHLQTVPSAVALEVWNAGHRAVIVHDFADHPGGVQSGQSRQVDGRLGLAGALEHAARLGLQREDVARLDKIARRRARIDRDLYRARPICRRDARGDAVAGLDRDRERGLERRLVLGRHQVQAQRVAALGRQRQADQPAPLLGHEVDRLGRGELRREREVALVLAVLVVAHDDHAAGADVLQRRLDRGERPAHRATSFSTYLASTSTSRLTGRPGAAAPSVVRSSVSGISATENQSSPISATVSETPSTAIDPFSTT